VKAARYHGREDVRIEDVPEPPPPGPGQMVLEVVRAGICGTDLHEYRYGPSALPTGPHPVTGRSLPITIGHEFIGRVREVGPGVVGFRPGDRVASGAGVSCGRCDACRRGETHLCRRYYTLGFQDDGGLAEYVLVPADTCHLVPPGVSDDDAVLAQPLASAIHAFRRSAHPPGEPLLVLGVGAIGSLFLAVATAEGVPVVAADRDPRARERALRLGAVRAATLEEIPTDGDGSGAFATVVDCTGRAEMLPAAARAVRPGGTVLLVGLQPKPVLFDFRQLVVREITVRTSNAHVCGTDLPAALAFLANRPLADVIVDRVVPLTALVDEGFRPALRGETHGKVLVAP
jgi:(R,R)-butanediol dehydrogenase/meso-butanediol dehydrogenase/diacetyl reductase